MAKLDLDLLHDLNLEATSNFDQVPRQPNSFYSTTDGTLLAVNIQDQDQLQDLSLGGAAKNLQFLSITQCAKLERIIFLTPLPQLELLYLDHCALVQLEIPTQCLALRQIYVQHNQLEKLHFAADCPQLQVLDASHNQLSILQLPTGMDQLKHLYLGDNELRELQPGSTLPALKTLHLRRNRLQHLPQNLVFDSPLTALYLAGNAPKDIPRSFLGDPSSYTSENCLDRARIWFQELADPTQVQPNAYIKLMFLGNGNAGKSSLLEALKNGCCAQEMPSTHGIQIGTFGLGPVQFNYWDFGGQEVYHGTHRLFMEAEAIQLILFDPETEALARDQKRVQDRASQEQILNYPLRYWYEISQELSPDSHFAIVQNKIDHFKAIDQEAQQYAQGRAAFFALSARTGKDVEDLVHYLRQQAPELPEFGMLMPKSWLQVRQFFIDNLAKEKNSTKLINKADFVDLCDQAQVSEASRDLLFQYLHNCGFLYYHPNLGDKIIADQRWALDAIYAPLKRGTDPYEELRDLQGKIRVKKLFQVFGLVYNEDEKKLFLDFMRSCGLCFQLNDPSQKEGHSEDTTYIFPEFLPVNKPLEVKSFWENRAQEVVFLRYKMPYLNYAQMQTFISALGRKTETYNIWRNGIHVPTPEGWWFKVELDYDESAVVVAIEEAAMPRWLKPILEELRLRREDQHWKISRDGGRNFKTFDLEAWEKDLKAQPHQQRELDLEPEVGQKSTLSDRLDDQPQPQTDQVILFLASNPLAANNRDAIISMRAEHSHIAEKLSEPETRKKFELIPRFGISPENMLDAINDYPPAVVHFVGHGLESDPDTRLGGGLYFFSDDKQRAQLADAAILSAMFRRIKRNHPQLAVILLNACYSEAQAQAISSHGIFTIGSNDELPSEAARLFAAGFYRHYALHKDVKKAVDNGLTLAIMANKGCDVESLIHLFYNGNRITV